MTLRRLIVCVVGVVAISIVNVYHHALAVKYGYEIGRIEKQNSELSASIAVLEGKVTMLASPSRLRAENERQQLGLVSPSKWQEPATAVALARIVEHDRETVAR